MARLRRAKYIQREAASLAAVSIITLAWSRAKMFADQRVIALVEQGVISEENTKSEIIGALNNV